ncbi:MAG: galactokinase family protein [Eubacteriales bacterium]|nr:galactokinase family protein [Eubacteriales bacterium]
MADKNSIANLGNNEVFKNSVKSLYGIAKFDYEVDRYRKIYELHSSKYAEGGVFYSSPGRIEVCGNHTDHNNGKVLCAAITVDTIACVTPLAERKIIVDSVGYPTVEINIDDLTPNSAEFGTSEALVRGVCAYYVDNGFNIEGFAATTTSDVFKGAGVSSSACFEVLVCEILNVMFNDGKIDKVTKAKASHHAESVFFGKPCGLMDQSAIALGGVSYIDFKSTSNPKIQTIDWKFNDLAIVLTNTGGDHCDLTSQYADIRVEMEGVAKQFKARKLRKVKESDFYAALDTLQTKVSGRAILRAMHFFDENKRVEVGARAVKSGKEKKFCEVINASGLSSYTMLQNCYPLGDLDQRIPLGINLSKKIDGVKAVRVHGGGFAGTIIAYVDTKSVDGYVEQMKNIFGDKNVFAIGVRNDGACKVEM